MITKTIHVLIATPNVAQQHVLEDAFDQLSQFQPLFKTAVSSWASLEKELAEKHTNLLFVDMALIANDISQGILGNINKSSTGGESSKFRKNSHASLDYISEFTQTSIPTFLRPHLRRTVFIGPDSLELANRTLDLGALDYIVSKHLSPVRLRSLLKDVATIAREPDIETDADKILRSTDIGFVLVDRRHKIQAINLVAQDAIAKLSGVRPLVDADVYTIAREPHILRNILNSVFRSGETEIEVRMVGKSDEERSWFEFRYSPVTTKAGEIEYVSVSVRDVTGTYVARQAQERSKANLRAILNSTHVMWLLVDRQQRLNTLSESMRLQIEHTLGRTLQPGEPLFEGLIPQQYGDFSANFERALRGEGVTEEARPEPDVWLQIDYVPVEALGEGIVGVCLAVQDQSSKMRSLQAEERLSRQLNFILNHAPLILWTADEQGRVRSLEGQGTIELSVDAQALIGQRFLPRAAMAAAQDSSEVTTEKPYIFNTPFRGKTYKNFVFQGQMGASAYMGVSIDISDRVALDKQIRDQASLLDQISDAIVLTDRDLRIQTWNRAAETIFNIPAAEAVNQIAYEILPSPFDSQEAMREAQKLLTEQSRLRRDYGLVNHNGDKRYLEAVFTPYQTDAQEVAGTIAVLRDVTALRLAERERARLVGLIENAREMVVLVAPNGRFEYINSAGSAFLQGVTSLAEMCTILCADHEPQDAQQVMQTAIESGWWQTEVQLRHLTLDVVRDVHLDLFPMRDLRRGKLLGFGLMAHDITAVKNAERELQRSLDQMVELNRLRSMFINTVSHEFRNPLATILTSSDLLRNYWERLASHKREERLDKIKQQVSRMVALLDDVLLYGSLENGEDAISRQPVNIQVMVAELVQDFVERFAQSHQIYYDFFTSDSDVAKVDPKLMGQIVDNLVSNAIKYSPRGGVVMIDLELTPENAILQVVDQGIGIPKADQQALFQMFHRAHNIGKIQGTGLGLAIVRRAVDLHQGQISFESVEGQGSSFTITVPRA